MRTPTIYGSYLLGVGCFATLIGCGNASETPYSPDIPVISFDAGTYCDEYTDRLRACDLLGKGRFQGCHDFADEAEACEQDCLSAAPCNQVQTYYCGRGGSQITMLEACMEGCIGESAVSCKDGTLRSSYARCDGNIDCEGGEDETDCDGSASGRYACRDGEFVDIDKVCDGEADCENAVDEAFCDTLFVCEPSAVGPSFISIRANNACDGVKDCRNGDDEPSDCAVATCD